jgi:hypothetical protein
MPDETIVDAPEAEAEDYRSLVEDLAVKHRAKHALRRLMAAGMVGPSVHRSDAARRALEQARDHDRHPVVRKIAGWYTPGGPLFRRLQPVTAPRRRPSVKGVRRLARELG